MHHARAVVLRDGSEATVRSATVDDAGALLAHVNEIGAEEVYILTERSSKSLDEERAWIASYDGQRGQLFVATIGGELVGSADISRGRWAKDRHVAHLGIALQRRARGKGLGRALMQACLDWARAAGVRKVTLGVFATNERARRLYQSLGFVEEARLRGAVVLQGALVDDLVMSLWLDGGPPPS